MNNTSITLLKQELWATNAYSEDATPADKIRLSYMRARSIVKQARMTVEDITSFSSKFKDFHMDYVVTADSAAAVILIIHWNLCMGTIAQHLKRRPDLSRLVQQLQDFDVCGEFMLSEIGQGLDARNIQTTATRNPDGSFDLHTPSKEASKIMPPTTTLAGVARVAVVFAQLIVDGERRGVRPFIVKINGERTMAAGVKSRLMPMRSGPKCLDHAVTTFDHVHLEPSSLLGDISKPADVHVDFLRQIQRVTVGAFTLATMYVPILRLSGYIVGRYSQQRLVSDGRTEKKIPIISFSTQHTPVLTALTTATVLQAFADLTWRRFLEAKDGRIRSALACIFKQTAVESGRGLCEEMIDRCGWRGLYSDNQLAELTAAMRGSSIAEGDVLVLCIRLASELLQGRYAVGEAADSTTLLARHEAGVWKDASEILASIQANGETHRSEAFNAQILPRARSLVQAIGDRMSYEAAAECAKVTPAMLELYETTCVARDMSWYVENLGLTRAELYARHAAAVQNLLPRLDEMLEETKAAAWATAPILSAEAWDGWMDGLAVFERPKEEKEEVVVRPSSTNTPWIYQAINSVRMMSAFRYNAQEKCSAA
ncbi:hypothetical protein L249_3165 [Ophiocordyceps polyrhachis-furcata BCC 54312]|uniref:Acyl-CoA oxidase C-terminal domain-containing protein n=1 Tax=Ophiocordyceps polyrhachis-furcata BCC 54312 TaxID=1330021 RepID=A0A367LPL2_9HYPO|nr:hypothetical protein L249_3165 [Ophiocordyceps polyrhachis-furcata BCC 54312]